MLNRASQSRVPVTKDITFPAPTAGWVKSVNITTAAPNQAEVLENFFPTAQGARLRGGSTEYADIGAAVKQLFTYSSGADTLFASAASGIYDCDRINLGGTNFADVTGLGSGDWSTAQISTSGGQFVVAVNGVDVMEYYDGANWFPINDATVRKVPYKTLSAPFSVGQTVTGGTSGATAVIQSITQISATSGTFLVGTITGGPFVLNEGLTSATGVAVCRSASSTASTVTITGVSTSDLSQTWLFKERLFFIEKNSLSAWYLPVKSIGGAAVEIPLGAAFHRGGNLLFGATWSLDSGSGIDDVCIFATDRGEIAVYSGTDPSSSSTWALTGIYEIAPPKTKHDSFKAGGDLALLTADGIIPVSSALQKDRAALQSTAITFPIEDGWKAAMESRTTEKPVTATLWQSRAMLLVGVPGEGSVAFVANAKTGAWATYTGWDVRCSAVASDLLFFGSADGIVRQAEDGGADGDLAYTGLYVPKFSDLGAPQRKVAIHAGLTVRATKSPSFAMAAFSDYKIGTYPTTTPINTTSGATWGTGTWGTFVWGGTSSLVAYSLWKTVRAGGYSLAPVVVVSSNQTEPPEFEILATRLRYEIAATL